MKKIKKEKNKNYLSKIILGTVQIGKNISKKKLKFLKREQII